MNANCHRTAQIDCSHHPFQFLPPPRPRAQSATHHRLISCTAAATFSRTPTSTPRARYLLLLFILCQPGQLALPVPAASSDPAPNSQCQILPMPNPDQHVLTHAHNTAPTTLQQHPVYVCICINHAATAASSVQPTQTVCK